MNARTWIPGLVLLAGLTTACPALPFVFGSSSTTESVGTTALPRTAFDGGGFVRCVTALAPPGSTHFAEADTIDLRAVGDRGESDLGDIRYGFEVKGGPPTRLLLQTRVEVDGTQAVSQGPAHPERAGTRVVVGPEIVSIEDGPSARFLCKLVGP